MSYEVSAKKSTTYRNLGDYGEFLNAGRVKAWRYALDSVLPADVDRRWVVDLGCSYGSWVENYRELGFDRVFGIDSNPEVAERAETACDRFLAGDSARLADVDVDFELIGCNGVIVHVLEDRDLSRLLADARSALPERGRLLVSGVNARWWYSSGRQPSQNEYFRVRLLEDYERLAAAAGFEVEARIGTFIDPWSARDFEHLALDQPLREEGAIFGAFDAVADVLRGRHVDPFTELLFCLRPAA